MSKQALGTFPGFDEELERLRTLGHEAIILGNREEVRRILNEDVYNFLFQQDQYQRQLYRTFKNFAEENPELKPIVGEYLSKLEQSIRNRAEALNSWSNDVRGNLKLFEDSIKVNSEEGK
ncbi:MAG: hypothetical protein AABW51_00455 [Nanoarchaeota archaeon]